MTNLQQEEYLETLITKLKTILLSKRNDYAFETDALSNFKVVGNICGIKPEIACLTLIATKVARLSSLLSENKLPNNESIDDSILDLINYGILLSMINSESK
ncbi:MAG TPA: hypothetical protein PKD00_00115 [Burkholderiales bacterium]|nr:hypothetical protein [Burkholderiales bacterium]